LAAWEEKKKFVPLLLSHLSSWVSFPPDMEELKRAQSGQSSRWLFLQLWNSTKQILRFQGV